MATPEEINIGIIEPLTNLFGDPKRNDPAGFFDLIVDVLEAFDAEAFPAAIRSIAIKHKYNAWPSVHEIRLAVEKAPISQEQRGDLPRYEQFDRKRKAQNSRKLEWADTIAKLQGPMAVDAAQNGWAKELFDFVRQRGELPFPKDEAELKATASRTWHQQETVLRGEFITSDGEVRKLAGPVKAIQEMAQAMRDREAKIAAHILNTNTTQEAS